jgi:hypothetical protein
LTTAAALEEVKILVKYVNPYKHTHTHTHIHTQGLSSALTGVVGFLTTAAAVVEVKILVKSPEYPGALAWSAGSSPVRSPPARRRVAGKVFHVCWVYACVCV